MSYNDPFGLMQIGGNAPQPVCVVPADWEQIADETVALLIDKLAAAEAKARYHEADTKRLQWLDHRLGALDYRISDEIFGNSDWTHIRDAVDAAMQRGL